MYFYDSGNGSLINNQIYNHSFSGIQIRSKSNPLIKNNKIWESKGGILVYTEAKGKYLPFTRSKFTLTIVYNLPFFNLFARSPFTGRVVRWFKKSSKETMTPYRRSHLTVPMCPHPHLMFLGIIEENDIFENAMAGIWVKLNSDPIVRNNKIHSGQDCGICIFSKSKGLYQK